MDFGVHEIWWVMQNLAPLDSENAITTIHKAVALPTDVAERFFVYQLSQKPIFLDRILSKI